MHLEGSSLEINGAEVWVKLPGRFNASNLLCIYGVAVLLGHQSGDVLQEISRVDPVKGRFETFRTEKGTTGIVDYAHTPDALSNVLETIREVAMLQGGRSSPWLEQVETVTGGNAREWQGSRQRPVTR